MPKNINKIFPKNNNFQYDSEGLWSITHVKEAEYLSERILDITKNKNLKIIDMTAGCGGNLISFILHFNNVTGIELNEDRFKMLEHNTQQYSEKNNFTILNDDCLKYINEDYDIFFFDPPWGGPEYKKDDNLKLYLSGIELQDIIKSIDKNKMIVLKIPFNYDYSFIKDKYILLEDKLIKNIRFLIFKI